MKKKELIIIVLLLMFSVYLLPFHAQELRQEVNPPEQKIPVVTGFLYGIQKYTGFNLFFDFF